MPAISAVTVDMAVNALAKYITFFSTDKLPEYSSNVWQDISNELKGLWKVPAVRINVRQDRRKILTLAREKCGIFTGDKRNISTSLNASSISSDNSYTTSDLNGDDSYDNNENYDKSRSTKNGDDDSDEREDFHVTITRQQWNLMKRDEPLIYKGRKYHGFEPAVWTNIVSLAFWEQYRLKCAFVFKRGKINENGINYAVMNGKCKERTCHNTVIGIIKDPPSNEGPVIITMKCRDTRFSKHADVKRPLNGQKRKEVQQKLLRTGVLGWRKEEAKNILKPGDTGSPLLYNSSTLYQVKKEANDKNLGINPDDRRDMILAIRKMNQDPQYTNSISWIGDTPFFVFYATPTQYHTYAEYLRIHKQHSAICIDATGGFVKKLVESRDKKTGHVFLYQIIINFDKTSIPIYQMLSEKHSARFISFWLSEWVQNVNLPQQAVSDGSRALLNAMAIAFNGKTLKEYINFCFENVITNNNLQPRTFIRLDSAHFLHAVSKWKCFQSVLHIIVKTFFLYCVALMIDCQELNTLGEIFIMILIVCNTEFADSVIAIGDRMITPREAKQNLQKLIEKRNTDITVIDSLEVDPDKNIIFEELSSKATDNKGWSIALLTWIDDLRKKANTVIFIGKDLNTHYVPDLGPELVDKMKDFPLWSNVCTPENMTRPTSCYVETDFKDLKMTLKKKVNLPTTVVKFMKLHITDILGGVNIFRSKLTKFVVDNYCSNENFKRSREVNLYENWKGRGKSEVATDYDWTLNYANESDNIEQNNPVSVSEKHTAFNANLAISTSDLDNSLIIFDKHNDHNYCASFKQEDKNFNKTVNIANKNNNIISDAGLPSTIKDKQNYCVISMQRPLMAISSIDSLDDSILSSSTKYFDNEKKNTYESLALKEDSDPLTLAVENMMKQKTAKKKVGHYFQNCPEIGMFNNLVKDKKSKSIKKRKDFLLRNGNKTGPVQFNGKKWTALNTCPFDSLSQIIFTAAMDNSNYCEFVTNSNLPVYKFMKSFIEKGAIHEIYVQRMALLNPIYYKNQEENETKIKVAPFINCYDNITNLWKILFKDAPSVIESTICSNSSCEIYTQALPAISANHKTITRQGFTALEKAVRFSHKIHNIRCRHCNKATALRLCVPKQHLFIELDIRDDYKCNKGKQCRLSELPIHLNFKLENDDGSETNLRYRISGVAAYTTGHYIAYCQRLGGNWQIYNDLSTKLESVSISTRVEPHAVFYVLE